jgi:hypothetical protein
MDTLEWLLHDSDPSLVFQVERDLLLKPEPLTAAIQQEIERIGHGSMLLAQRNADGQWGKDVYVPKWTCTHYVLFELVQLGISREQEACRESAASLLRYPRGADGGINYARTVAYSDVCINGMILNIVCYFGIDQGSLNSLVDYLLDVQMDDGGWNCEYLHGATHASLHTTISVLEGISRYLDNGYVYKRDELERAVGEGVAFILRHALYKSETTGEKIKDEFFKYTFPIRWKYDVLRCLDYFRWARIPYHAGMRDALDLLQKSKNKAGRWKAFTQAGKTYFDIEKNGTESKWNTLRALRVLKCYGETTATSPG